MKNKYQLFVAVVSGALALPLTAQAQVTYEYEQVDFPGASATQVFGINQPGVVAGTGFTLPESFPFIYDIQEGSFADVDAVAGSAATSVFGINNRGAVVGSVFDSSGMTRGFIRDHTGVETVFAHPDATFFTQARGINSRGLVTGFRDSGFFSVGFIYDPASATFTDIVPSLFTIAQGINARGDVVGSAQFSPEQDPCESPGASGRYGWLRTQQNAVSYFTVNGMPTSARGVDDSGTVAGFFTKTATDETETDERLGFVTVLSGTPCQDITINEEDLLVFPGAKETFPQGITNSGVIAGQFTDQDDVSHGFIARPE